MAYYSQEQKKQVAPIIKAICQKFGVKGSLSVHHNSEVIFTATSGAIDFIGNANKIAEQRAAWREEQFYPAEGDILHRRPKESHNRSYRL